MKGVSEQYDIMVEKPGEVTISLKGSFGVQNAAAVLRDITSALSALTPTRLTVDIGQVRSFDDYGALILFELKHLLHQQNGNFHIVGATSSSKEIFSQVNFDTQEKCFPQKRKRTNSMVRLGDATLRHLSNVRIMIAFVGSVVLCFMKVLYRPRSLRFEDTLTAMEKTGVDALPIVALISFLLGLIIAFMSSMQLEQFGANIYVASLVTLAMTSELGPIMTAIIVAGRSGSAYAAEIGTMKISEEIDALFTMGFDPTLFLTIPRMVASMVVVPLLTIFSNLFAIAGGLVVSTLLLGLTPGSYIDQTIETLTRFKTEIVWGLGKSVIFAILISLISCLRGFQARGGAAAVGNAATSAVVSSIFLIILFDSIFAVIRSYWG